MDWALPAYNFRQITPEIILAVTGMLLVALDAVWQHRSGSWGTYTALLALLVAAVLQGLSGYGGGYKGVLFNDPFSLFFKVLIFVTSVMVILLSPVRYVRHTARGNAFFAGLFLLSTVGLMLMVSSHDMMFLVLSLQLAILPLLVVCGLSDNRKEATPAGIHLWVMAGVSMALLIFGASLIYGLSGTTNLLQIKINLAITHLTFQRMGPVLQLAMVILLMGLALPLGLPPFHQWLRTVHRQVTPPVSAVVSLSFAIAVVVLFAKLFANAFGGYAGSEMAPNDWGPLAGILIVLAITIPNVLTLSLTNLKQALALFIMGQVGCVLLGFLTMGDRGVAAAGFYLWSVILSGSGAFVVLSIFEHESGACQVASLEGIGRTSPMLAHSLTIFLLSLVGLPPLVGFIAKFRLISATIESVQYADSYSWLVWLIVITLVSFLLPAVYFGRVIFKMYASSQPSPYRIRVSGLPAIALVMCLISVILFGLLPEPMLRLADEMVKVFAFMPR